MNAFVYWAHAHGILATCDGDPKQLDSAEDIADEGLKSVRTWKQPRYEPAFHVLKAMIQHGRNPDQLDSAIAELQEGLKKATEPRATHLNSGAPQVPTDRWHVEKKLVEFLVEADRVIEARREMEKALSIRRSAFYPGHIQTILAEIRLGEFLQRQGLHSRTTSERLEEVFEKLQPFSPVLDAARRRLAQLLCDVYESLDNEDKAAEWQSYLQQLNGTNVERKQASLESSGSPFSHSIAGVSLSGLCAAEFESFDVNPRDSVAAEPGPSSAWLPAVFRPHNVTFDLTPKPLGRAVRLAR